MRVMDLENRLFQGGWLFSLLWIAFAGCNSSNPMAVSGESQGAARVSLESGSGPEVNCEAALGEWRSYRLEQKEISDVRAYSEGFMKGCTGPAGLVDGAPDYNLGHSDGMLAAMGKNPPEEGSKDQDSPDTVEVK